MARNYFSGMPGSGVGGLNGNITNSAPNWVGLGLGLSLAIIRLYKHFAKLSPSSSFSWAVLVLFPAYPSDRPAGHPAGQNSTF